MKNIALVTLLLILLGNYSIAFSKNQSEYVKAFEYLEKKGEVYFKFNINSQSETSDLIRKVSIDNVKGNEVYAYANKEEFQEFLYYNLDYDVLTHPGDLIKDPKMNHGNPGESLDWTAYPTYEQYDSTMSQFATDYPNLCKIVEIGQSVQGRKLLYAKISDNVNTDEAEPEFMYISSLHGDETGGYVSMLHLIDSLLSGYSTSTRIQNLVDNIEIWINPLSNPDGTYYGGNNSVAGARRYNANDADLNRCFPYIPGVGTSDDPEQENTAIMNFMGQHNFVMSADFHAGVETVIYPWHAKSSLTADDAWFQYVAREYADSAQNYSPAGYLDDCNDGICNGYADLGYVAKGTLKDYSLYYQGCRATAIEMSLQKLLPENQLNNYWNYNYRSFLNYIEQVLYGINGTITDSISSNPLKAKVFVESHDVDSSWVYSDSANGDYYRPIIAGTYNVTFSCDGYVSKTISDVIVTNNNATVLDVELSTGTPISITSHPKPDTALEDSTAQFSVTATGTSLSYQWQRNDGGWNDVPSGGTSEDYSFTAAAGDNGVWFRCVVTSNPQNVTSDSAMLTIATKPSVPDQFSPDTVIAVNGNLSLTGSATSIPSPAYEWFFINPASPTTPISKGSGATLSLTNATKADSGTYYFVADNNYSSTSSDSIFVHILAPVSITVDLPSTNSAINGGEAAFSIEVAGNGTISYQWYENTILMSGQTQSSLSINPVNSSTHDGNKYYCSVTNTFLGITVGAATSDTCTLEVSDYYNPFKVKAERIDISNTTQVRMKLWGGVDISNFPSSETSEPWADSVWVMYKTKGYATDTTGVPVKRYSIDEIKQAASTNDSLIETLTVGELQGDHDSCYWFNYTVLWHVPAGSDELLSFTEANKVFMFDTNASENPLSVYGEYFDRTDSALMVIEGISLLNSTTDSIVAFQCSRYSDFSTLLFDSSISVTALQAAGNKDTLIVHNLGVLPIETDTAHYRWYIIGKNAMSSVKKTTKFEIGWDRPVYTGTLITDTTSNIPDQVKLSWSKPVSGTDSVRIWWDINKIPLEHNVNLPIGQAFYASSPDDTNDIVRNLNPSTVYHFGLQIYKDMMWSYITENSSDSIMTPQADSTLIVPNKMSFDTSWFDTALNVINAKWSIDTTDITTDTTLLQWGYSYSIDPDVFKTTQPSQWSFVEDTTGAFYIDLGTGILFDTTYYIGLWLRAKKYSGGIGIASGPGDSVKTEVKTPSHFTWQVVTLSQDKPDTAYAMNGRIIIISITPFAFTDTLRGYNRQAALPGGIADLGGTGFRFSKVNLQVPDFKIGMKHNPVRSLITNDNKNIYKDCVGPLNVIYGSEAEDSVVWTMISGADMAYPFLVLADTAKPTISFAGTITDTAKILDPDSSVTTQFSISDNISNVKWQFSYGAGNMGYAYGTEGYLDTCMKILTTVIPASDNVVSPAFGLRAIVIVNDGVYTDTVHVSRRVNVSNSDAITAPSMEWVPLRATSTLADSTIQTVLSNFVNEQGIWEYDRTKFLAAQWYDTTAGLGCEVIEYSDALHDDFSFIPGRIVWLKSAETQTINFGPGVTTSLKETFTIILQGYCWSDFSLPYKFPVKLKDILAATGIRGDSLVFYHWVKSDSTYVAAATYIPALDSASGKLDTITIRYSPLNDAYTVYSYSSAPMALKIPPIPPALSPGSGARTESTQKQRDIWDISLLWKKENSSFINKVRCGYNGNGTGKTLIGPLPPSFGKIGAGVSDGNGRIGGYAVHNRIDKGGLNYEIVFYNTSKKSETIEYFLDNLISLPEGYSTRVYNPVTAEFEKDKTSVILKANSSERRWVVIGTENYLNGFLENNIVSSFALLGTYPNPFRGRINIQYMVPWQGVKKIKFRIFDLRGCTVWEEDISKGIRPGINTITWNTNGKSGKRIASGIYLLRMTIYENGKKGYKVFQRKLTCLY